VTQHLPRWFSG